MALPAQHLDIISLCTGGYGLDFGVELAVPGARAICCVEREAFAVARLVAAMQQGLIPESPVWSDVRTFPGRSFRGLVDGLIGGIPCQGHSLAGRKRGSLDERDLWSPARKIIAAARPWFVLIENVRGMLSAGLDEIAGAERVWRDLRKLGFIVETGLFTSAEVGASHERERIFIFAVADDAQRRWGVGRASLECDRTQIETGGCGFDVGRPDNPRLERHGRPVERAGERLTGPDDVELADTDDQGRSQPRGSIGEIGGWSGDGSDAMADSDIAVVRRQSPAGQLAELQQDDGAFPLYPPGPSDIAAWRAIAATDPDGLPALSLHDRFEIALRNAGIDPPRHQSGKTGRAPRVHAPIVQAAAKRFLRGKADGMASRLDQLRLLGNGVNPLQAAYAIRTLATRLAARGSDGAGELVRMMNLENELGRSRSCPSAASKLHYPNPSPHDTGGVER